MKLRKSWRLAFCIAMLILAVIGCDLGEGTIDDAVNHVSCGTLIKICDDTEHPLFEGARDLSDDVAGPIRYYRFWDCAMGEWLQSSCSADCTVEIRFTRTQQFGRWGR